MLAKITTSKRRKSPKSTKVWKASRSKGNQAACQSDDPFLENWEAPARIPLLTGNLVPNASVNFCRVNAQAS